jgi:hypothetical protein
MTPQENPLRDEWDELVRQLDAIIATPAGFILMNPVTGMQNQVIKRGLSNSCIPSWSPDGSRLAVRITAGQVNIPDAELHIRLIALQCPQ